eukprot:13470168-Alexandrium_andersonii.AAC.1
MSRWGRPPSSCHVPGGCSRMLRTAVNSVCSLFKPTRTASDLLFQAAVSGAELFQLTASETDGGD